MTSRNKILDLIKKRPLFLAVGIPLIFSVGFVGSRAFRPGKGVKTEQAVFATAKGPLTISVIASGTVKAREQIIIKNEVEGRTSIIYLVPEGTRVREGDLLVELDASKLLDEKIDQEIKVQNADAAFVGARENMAVVENQAESDVDKAQLAYDFAKEDLKKYLEGEYPNQMKESESKITLANEELTRANEKMVWSKRLYDEKYISETEMAADELTKKRKELDLELARSNRDLLINYTHKRKLAQLESDMKQAEMALDRTVRKAKADVVQAKANLEAKEAELGRQKDKLKKIEAGIRKARIYAPAEGLVIHATSTQTGGPGRRATQPLDEGQEVRERQELIHLPTTAAAKVEVAIHEASLDKIRIGLPVKVTLDALPGETFWGKVAKIAPLPDAQSAWLNPDLKVYNMDIYLEKNSSALRTGMSCKAEIIVEQHREAVYIPVQAVLRIGGEPTVYVVKEGKTEPRKVEIGLDNNRMVRIVKGLAPGETVSMTPPLAAASIEPAEFVKEMGTTAAVPARVEEGTAPAVGSGGAAGRPAEGPSGREKAGRSETTQGATRTGGVDSTDPPGVSSGERQGGGRGAQNLSPEEQQKRKRFSESLTPEERERFSAMSSEEKKKFRESRTGDPR